MKSHLIATGSAFALFGVLFDAAAGERIVKKAQVLKPVAATKAPTHFSTSGYQPVQHYQGRMTIETAVAIALRQNPDVLRAIQEIERTRGQIIEVRAQALPQITITGTYDQQDRRLLQGGGAGAGQGGAAQGGGLGAVDFGQLAGGGNGGAAGGGNGAAGNGDQTGSEAIAEALQDIFSSLGESGQRGGTVQNKSWRVAIEVRQVIYAGGQIRAALNIARLSEDSAYWQLRDTIDQVISSVRQQFYLVLANRALITVQEEAVRLAEQQLADQRNRFEAGTVPRFNVLRAEVELSNVQPNLIRARNDYLLAQIQLAKLLGLSPGPGGRPEFVAVGDLSVSGRVLSLDDALILARARRPFLKVQRQQVLIEVEQIKVAKAGYKPRIDGRAGYEVRNNRLSDDVGDTVNGWFFGFTGTWDIFDGFETFGQVKQGRARLESARVTYGDSVQQVELEVQTAYANLEQARETIESQKKNVEQAREALRLAQERFAAGAGTQLEELDARVALTRAQITELSARADYNRALAEFDRATATDTVYENSWVDPLAKTERGVLEKIASIGLTKPGTSEFQKRIEQGPSRAERDAEKALEKEDRKKQKAQLKEERKTSAVVVQEVTTVTEAKVQPAPDGKRTR